nr:uncharacterized mitochondrial protein AtMg00810-like [Tanacetum cinerariifolium]
MMNRQHGRIILEFVQNGQLIWPTIEEKGVTRPRKYFELTHAEAIQADCDVKETNIILQVVVTSRYSTTNNQLRNSSNPRPQATINDGRVTLQPVHGRQISFATGTTRTYTLGASGSNSGKQMTVICYNCKGEGHIVIEKSDAIVIPDTKETLMLAEVSRSKMIEKQNDPKMTEKKVITKPIDYAIINQLSTDFETRFVPQTELSAEQAFWSQYSVQNNEPNLSVCTTIVEVPKELPTVSMHSKLTANFELICFKCNGNMLSDNHDLCVLNMINDVNAYPKSKSVKKTSKRKVKNASPLTRIITTAEVPLKKPTALETDTPKPIAHWFTQGNLGNPKLVVQIVLWYLNSGCSKHMTEDLSQLTNFVNKFLGIVKFGNDHVEKIMGHGDYQIGNVTISRVYYMEGLGHNLFSVRQLCDSNLEVAFHQHTCYIRNLKGVDLLTGSRGNNLYTLSLRDMMASSPICLLPFVFTLCNGKKKKETSQPKSEDTNQEKLYLLHMDLCGPMRVASVNEKKYILVIVDDYSRFIWVKCLRSKDEASDFIIKFLKMIQLWLKTHVRRIRTDNGTRFVNQTLHEYYKKVGISHETSVARSSHQNGVVKRRNRTLIEVYEKAPLFLWAEAVATAYFDELTAMASEHSSLEPVLHEMTHATISSGLVPNLPLSIPYVPPLRTKWDILFQPLFDELLTLPPNVDPPAPQVIAPIAKVVALKPAESTGSPSSTTVDQDAPSPSNSQTTSKTQSLDISNDVEEENHDLDTTHMNNDPFFRILILKNDFESSSSDVIPAVMHTAAPNSEHISQSRRGIFLNQSKYGLESLEKYGMESSNPVDIPMVEKSKLDEDPQAKTVDPTHYRGMVGTLMYLTASRPNLTFAISMCARYQAKPTKKHLHTVKRIFKNLRGTVNRGLWYPKDSSIALTAYADADHMGCQDIRRSTSGKKVENGVVELYFVNTKYQLANIFTKALCRERIEFLINKLGMQSFMPETLKLLADEAEE